MPGGGEAAAQEFYEGLLGLRRVPKPPHLERRGGCWFENANVKVHLGVDADFRPARKAHPALVVEGLGPLVERLRAAGVTVRDDEPLAAYVRAYVDDPFGNRIELLEPLGRTARGGGAGARGLRRSAGGRVLGLSLVAAPVLGGLVADPTAGDVMGQVDPAPAG